METVKPATRPANPRFSSGPCAKFPQYSVSMLDDAWLGRSHRAAGGKAKLHAAIEETRAVLKIPADYRIGIVPASDTGAVEMAMWSLLGARPVTMVAWESFGQTWVKDASDQLKLDANIVTAPYGDIVDMTTLDYDHDIVFTWNGTTSGVRLPEHTVFPVDRGGLTICDATSASFAMPLPWESLDVTTFSWQKVLGSEAGHGMIVLSPRACERLENFTPSWPVPKIFQLVKNGKLIEGIFAGDTINTPSMLAVEDYLQALKWAHSVGGLDGLIRRSTDNAQLIWDFTASRNWITNLASDPATWSTTSVCLVFSDPAVAGHADFAKAVVKRLSDEGVAYDIGSYRAAPAGLRIWCGATVESSDIAAMLPWLEWAYAQERKAFA
ncbi:MAG: phosphoserine transaminase [Candidatus Puniceispirillales bacterium]